jgi:transcriptional regulator with XRE-family HTH domain
MNQRIREFLLAENKSSAQLAEEIGVQPSGISHILSGRNKPSLDFILKMLEKYPSLSTDWLLFGKGTMYTEITGQSLFDEVIDYKEEKVDNIHQDKRLESDSDVNETLKSGIFNDISTTEEATSNTVEKIVWFYSDNSFEEYFPGK